MVLLSTMLLLTYSKMKASIELNKLARHLKRCLIIIILTKMNQGRRRQFIILITSNLTRTVCSTTLIILDWMELEETFFRIIRLRILMERRIFNHSSNIRNNILRVPKRKTSYNAWRSKNFNPIEFFSNSVQSQGVTLNSEIKILITWKRQRVFIKRAY